LAGNPALPAVIRRPALSRDGGIATERFVGPV
jgi:hypothetical protein